MGRNTSTVVELSEQTHETTFADGKEYRLPNNVTARLGNRKTTVNSLKVESGNDLASQLDVSASLSGSYAGFSASASGQYSFDSSMSSSKNYALLSVDHTSFTLNLKGHKELDTRISEEFVDDVEQLPTWDLKDSVYERYMQFFDSWGTHIVKSCTFGARYQLKVEGQQTESQSKEEFEVNVSAEYSGVASVKGDVSVKQGGSYKNYHKTRKFQTRVYGGSDSSNTTLANAPDDPEKYQEAFNSWAESLNDAAANNLISVQIDSVGNVLKNSSVQKHRDLAPKLVSALDYLASMRLTDGVLKVALPLKSEPSAYTRELVIQGAPGVQISHTTPPILLVSYEILFRARDGGNADFVLHSINEEPATVSFAKSPSNALISDLNYGGLENTRTWREIQGRDGGELTADFIEGKIPISILSPPSSVVVRLSSPRKPTNTDLDLSPGGPKLHLPESRNDATYPVESLFRPGFAGEGLLIGTCFAANQIQR